MKTALVLGAGGFIGSHMVTRLRSNGYYVIGIDLKHPKFCKHSANEFIIADLRDSKIVQQLMMPRLDYDKYDYVSVHKTYSSIDFKPISLVVQLAADMGGMEYLAGGEHDADVMHNSSLINLNVAYWASKYKVGKVFYSSSACIYPLELQESTDNVGLKESDSIPAHPDLCYGWEKLHSEIIYDAFRRNYGLDVRIARFHNIYGENGTWQGDKAKSPAALCRKVAMAKDGDQIEVWGSGEQTRSFLYIDECVDGVMKLINSEYTQPLNIGSNEMVSINQLAEMIIKISGKKLTIKNVESDKIGVNGRNSNNDLIKEVLNWSPTDKLYNGILKTYCWVNKQVNG